MIWPFLMIYVKERLQLPLATVTTLLTINSATGIIAAFAAGPVIDRFGRKWIMVFSLFGNGLVYALQSQANTLTEFAVLMAFSGIFNPLYRVGTDAMLADLIPAEKRPDAYALIRLSNNIGIAIGPAVGGFITTISYTIAFFIAAAGLILYSLLLLVFAVETIPDGDTYPSHHAEAIGGYRHILRDVPFISFSLSFIMTQMCAVLIWVLMSVYAKTQFQVPESQYGWIATTNALMVVLLQVRVTAITKRRHPLLMMMVGAFFYAIGVGSVAFAVGFWGFWSSMVIMTIGELILMPTSSTYVANLAPQNMRGRYMSVYGLAWNTAAGIAPVVGGTLSDNFNPRAPWLGGLIIGLLSMLAYATQYRKSSRITP